MSDARDRPPRPPPNQDQPVSLPSPEDSNLVGERPPLPDWLRDPQNEVIRIGNVASTIFTEGDFEEAVIPTGAPVPPQGPDALAYYLPYHFYRNGVWGVYLRAMGILGLAAELKGGPIVHGSDNAIHAAVICLFEHELFHCFTEAAATRTEVVVRSPVYHPYFFDRHAAPHEEAVANAHAHGKITKTFPAFLTRLEAWMGSQGPGYRDFRRYLGRSFHKGKTLKVWRTHHWFRSRHGHLYHRSCRRTSYSGK